MRSMPLLSALLASSTALAAPGAGTDVLPPADAWSEPSAGDVDDTPWWRRLGDPVLDALVADAVGTNYDVAGAWDRVRQADALKMAALAPLLPQIAFDYTLSGETDDVRAGRTGFLTTDQLPDFVYSGSGQLGTSLEIDLFGRNVLGVQAASNDVKAAQGDKAALASSIASRLVGAWLDHASAIERLATLEAQRRAAASVLELTELRLRRAEATGVDVQQQRQQVASIDAQIPLLRAARDVAAQQIAVLTGNAPSWRPPSLPTRLPEPPARGGLGTPDDLLEHRGDLLAAQARLRAAWQRRLARERAFLPRLRLNFNLTGSYSNTQKINFGVTGATVEYGSVYGWTVGGGLSWPIFDGGLSIAQLRQARAAESGAANALSQSILNAEAQVEAALTTDREQLARRDAVRAQALAARQAYELAQARYGEGVGDYLTVFSTFSTWRAAEIQRIQADRDLLAARIQLLDALGGDWVDELGADPSRSGR